MDPQQEQKRSNECGTFSGSFEEQVFSNRYQRNNKRGGLKNLRCFPTCGFRHKERGFCGRPILVVVKNQEGGIDSNTAKRLHCWAEFMLEASEPKYKVGDTISYSDGVQSERNNEQPTRPWIRGTVTSDPAQRAQGNIVFELNREKRGWHYGWTSNKHTCDALHCLQCYIFTSERPIPRSGTVTLTCCATFRSPSFRLFCRRRRRFQINPSAPIAPKNARQSGIKVKAESVFGGGTRVTSSGKNTSAYSLNSSHDYHEYASRKRDLYGSYVQPAQLGSKVEQFESNLVAATPFHNGRMIDLIAYSSGEGAQLRTKRVRSGVGSISENVGTSTTSSWTAVHHNAKDPQYSFAPHHRNGIQPIHTTNRRTATTLSLNQLEALLYKVGGICNPRKSRKRSAPRSSYNKTEYSPRSPISISMSSSPNHLLSTNSPISDSIAIEPLSNSPFQSSDFLGDSTITDDFFDFFLPRNASQLDHDDVLPGTVLQSGELAVTSSNQDAQDLIGSTTHEDETVSKEEQTFLVGLTKYLLEESRFQHDLLQLAKVSPHGVPHYSSLLSCALGHVLRYMEVHNVSLQFVHSILVPEDHTTTATNLTQTNTSQNYVVSESSVQHELSTHNLSAIYATHPMFTSLGSSSGFPISRSTSPLFFQSMQLAVAVPNISGKWRRTMESDVAMQQMRKECGVTWVLSKIFDFMESRFEIEQDGIVVRCKLNFVANTTLRFVLDGEEHTWGFRIPFFPSLSQGLTYRAWVDGNSIAVSHTILGQRLTRINWTNQNRTKLHSTVILDEYAAETGEFVETMRCDQEADRVFH